MDEDKVDEKDEAGKDEDEEHENDEDKEDDDQSDGSNNIISVIINKEHCRKALAKMVIIDTLPFGFVNGEGFREFSRALYPDFDQPSRKEIARTVLQLYLEEKRRLRSNLSQNKQRVCLTVKTWGLIQTIVIFVSLPITLMTVGSCTKESYTSVKFLTIKGRPLAG